MQLGVTENAEYLERFFRNLLMGETNDLKSRYMILGTKWESAQESLNSTQESTQEKPQSTQEKILEELKLHPFTTREQLAAVIGITPDGIKKQLDKLRRAGIIRHVGATKNGHWEVCR